MFHSKGKFVRNGANLCKLQYDNSDVVRCVSWFGPIVKREPASIRPTENSPIFNIFFQYLDKLIIGFLSVAQVKLKFLRPSNYGGF